MHQGPEMNHDLNKHGVSSVGFLCFHVRDAMLFSSKEEVKMNQSRKVTFTLV